MKKLQIGCAAMTLVVLFLAKAPRLQSKSNSAPSTPSNHSLTADQIAVYRAVISEYLRNSPGKLNISRLTDAMGQVEPSLNQECIRGIDLEKANPTPAIHELDSLAESNSQLMLVDRNEQQQQVERNDPQNLLDRASDNHERVTESKLNDSVKRAFETGLFTLSEILFDKQHRHAIVAYSFVCGGLCGSRSTLVLKKAGSKWKISKRCGGWVS